jgi:hypothetical protein
VALHPVLVCVDGALAAAVPDIVRVTRRHAVFTAGTSRAMVDAGVALGVTARSGRAALIVNLPAARAEGADRDAALLAITQVIRE